jgi:L-lysine 6-transaminase
MVRGQRYVEIMHEDSLLHNSAAQGEYMLSELRGLMDRGAALQNVRGRGLLLAFDMPDVAARDHLLIDAYDAGLLLIGCGARSVRVRPHLDVKREALDATLEILDRVLPRQ